MLYQDTQKTINDFSNKLTKAHGDKLKASCFKPFMRNKDQLIIEPYASLTDGKNPLSAPHESFCRFAITILKDLKPVTMNMRWSCDTKDEANSFLEFKELFEYAKSKHIEARFNKNTSTSSNSAAFTLPFRSGNQTKGKTCVQVLKENDKGVEILKSQREFLEKKLGTYKSNQQYIDAIDEALNLSPEQIAGAESSMQFILFDSGLRSKLSTVLKNEKIKPNTSYERIPCFNGSITFYPGMEHPLEVKISNFFATVNTDENCLAVIDTKTAIEKIDATISLTFGESLRLFEELSHYYDIKSEELYYYGIAASESFAASQRGSNNNKSTNATSNKNKTSSADETSNKSSENIAEEKNVNVAPENTEVTKEKEIKVLKFESCSSISKLEDSFIIKAKFVRSDGSVDNRNEYTIIFNSASSITKDEFTNFRDMTNDNAVEFEIECYQENDGIHVIKFAA